MYCKWKVIPLVTFVFFQFYSIYTLFVMFENFVFSILVAKASCCFHMLVKTSSKLSCNSTSKFEILRLGTPLFIRVPVEFLFPYIFGRSLEWAWHKWRTDLFVPVVFFSRLCFFGVGSNCRRPDWTGWTTLLWTWWAVLAARSFSSPECISLDFVNLPFAITLRRRHAHGTWNDWPLKMEPIMSRSVGSILPTNAALRIKRAKTSALNRSAACLMLLFVRKVFRAKFLSFAL
jgi:hypothetical protein